MVIVINAILGTVQTLKAEKSLESLKKLSIPKVKVLRDGQLCELDVYKRQSLYFPFSIKHKNIYEKQNNKIK